VGRVPASTNRARTALLDVKSASTTIKDPGQRVPISGASKTFWKESHDPASAGVTSKREHVPASTGVTTAKKQNTAKKNCKPGSAFIPRKGRV
jgi:hypothetical protein